LADIEVKGDRVKKCAFTELNRSGNRLHEPRRRGWTSVKTAEHALVVSNIDREPVTDFDRCPPIAVGRELERLTGITLRWIKIQDVGFDGTTGRNLQYMYG